MPWPWTTDEAARVTGCGIKTIDAHARSGFLAPSIREAAGTGSRRAFGFADLCALRALVRLRAAGIPVAMLGALVNAIQNHRVLAAATVRSTAVRSVASIVVTDGSRVREVAPSERFSVLASWNGGAFVAVPLAEIVSDVQERIGDGGRVFRVPRRQGRR